MAEYARAERLAAFGLAALARRLDDAAEVARTAGTSLGKARAVVTTGKVLSGSGPLTTALKHGDISMDQATEIAQAEAAAPGSAAELVAVAETQPFHVLKEQVRKTKLEAEQHRDLAVRQRLARFARTHTDELGMMHIHLSLQPHVATKIVARAEAEARRLVRTAKQAAGATETDHEAGAIEPFDRYLADAYATLLSGRGSASPTRPELVVLVSHEVAKRGWKDVGKGEVCKIPGIGPIAPDVAKSIAEDAFLSGVYYDGKDLRHFKRWSRSIPIEVRVALELGEPPDFDGVACVDCGNRFRCEFDHVTPRVANGPSSQPNLKPRCFGCHKAKTDRDRRAGKLTPAPPGGT